MSETEQLTAIGRLVTERSSARRHFGLLGQQIRDTGTKLYEAGTALTRMDMRELAKGLSLIEALISQGGLDGLQTAITEYQRLQARIAELTASLNQAGAE
jgi:hypothetical protein